MVLICKVNSVGSAVLLLLLVLFLDFVLWVVGVYDYLVLVVFGWVAYLARLLGCWVLNCSCVGLDLVWIVLVVYGYCDADWLFAYGCGVGVSGLLTLWGLDVWALSHACLLLLCGSLLRLLFGCCIDVVVAVYAFVFDLFTFDCLVWLSLRC